MKEYEAVRVDTGLHGQLISQIVVVCRNLKKSGESLLRNYFKLGRLVDTLHNEGYSYREIERALRNKEANDWIPRHTTLFRAHKFYLAVLLHESSKRSC
ncbi:hypothetical protein HRbin02_01431 [Candidatus Calditenuaceae archaeon HR02]|nr:hypothetical protein HRbin02_01431 [Candidatus Calditenuaceae archaeon HR02]